MPSVLPSLSLLIITILFLAHLTSAGLPAYIPSHDLAARLYGTSENCHTLFRFFESGAGESASKSGCSGTGQFAADVARFLLLAAVHL